MFFAVGSGTVVERRGHDDCHGGRPGTWGLLSWGFASLCHALYSSVPPQAFELWGYIFSGRSRCVSTEDVGEGGDVSQLFFHVELFAFSHRGAVPAKRRRDNLDLSSHLLGRSASCGEQNLWA